MARQLGTCARIWHLHLWLKTWKGLSLHLCWLLETYQMVHFLLCLMWIHQVGSPNHYLFLADNSMHTFYDLISVNWFVWWSPNSTLIISFLCWNSHYGIYLFICLVYFHDIPLQQWLHPHHQQKWPHLVKAQLQQHWVLPVKILQNKGLQFHPQMHQQQQCQQIQQQQQLHKRKQRCHLQVMGGTKLLVCFDIFSSKSKYRSWVSLSQFFLPPIFQEKFWQASKQSFATRKIIGIKIIHIFVWTNIFSWICE